MARKEIFAALTAALVGAMGGCHDETATIDAGVATDARVLDSQHVDAQAQKRVFVTSTTYSGDLWYQGNGSSGLDGADKLCNARAQAAGLPGAFQAWLSGASTDAIDRIIGAGPWYLPDSPVQPGALVFSSKSSMTSTPLVNIDRDETGRANVGFPFVVWTGTLPGGTKYTGSLCQDGLDGTSGHEWHTSVSDLAFAGGIGDPTTKTAWTYSGAFMCDQQGHLYCFQE
jgi:hypothetical protein